MIKVKKEQLYAKGYRNMSQQKREIKAARIASNDGKCWWVYQYLMARDIG